MRPRKNGREIAAASIHRVPGSMPESWAWSAVDCDGRNFMSTESFAAPYEANADFNGFCDEPEAE